MRIASLETDDRNASRRAFLKIAASASALLTANAVDSSALHAQDARPSGNVKLTARGGAIDVHHHHRPPIEGVAGNRNWTPAMSVDQMGRFGIASAVLSMASLSDKLYDGSENARRLTRICNDYGAKIMHDDPKRFGFMGALPFHDVDGSLKEIEYIYDTLAADGIGIYSSARDRWPGDPMFDPIFAELNRRKAIVFVHPSVPVPNCCTGLPTGVPDSMSEFDFDMTRAMTSLLAAGVYHRYPEIRFIMVHSGGALPVLAGRIKDRYPKDKQHAEYIPNGVIPELQKLYFEVAHATYKYPIAALRAFAQPSHILFGTDFSAEPIESTVNELPGSAFTQAELQAIERDNAEVLFPG